MVTNICHLLYQLWLHLGTALPAILSYVASTIPQLLQNLFISWVMQKRSERRKETNLVIIYLEALFLFLPLLLVLHPSSLPRCLKARSAVQQTTRVDAFL